MFEKNHQKGKQPAPFPAQWTLSQLTCLGAFGIRQFCCAGEETWCILLFGCIFEDDWVCVRSHWTGTAFQILSKSDLRSRRSAGERGPRKEKHGKALQEEPGMQGISLLYSLLKGYRNPQSSPSWLNRCNAHVDSLSLQEIQTNKIKQRSNNKTGKCIFCPCGKKSPISHSSLEDFLYSQFLDA